jgi:enamine deaminase RidA (YjgF/YER057c/UK114 family)
VRATRIIFIAGQTALDRDGALVGKNDFAAQAEQVFRNLSIALRAVGCTASDLVKLTVFVRDMGNLAAYREARNPFFATVTPPAAPGRSSFWGARSSAILATASRGPPKPPLRRATLARLVPDALSLSTPPDYA